VQFKNKYSSFHGDFSGGLYLFIFEKKNRSHRTTPPPPLPSKPLFQAPQSPQTHNGILQPQLRVIARFQNGVVVEMVVEMVGLIWW
jgi:hypothetical protein